MQRRSMLMLLSTGLASAACAGATQRRADAARPDLYNCEGCEGTLEHDRTALDWQARIGPVGEPGEPMRVEGRVVKPDGTTPAPGVIVYAHHTNADGLYAGGTGDTDASRRHGLLRAWVRTDAHGRYAFDTIKPAPYPDMTMPAHIHLMIGEPGRPPYYIDDIVFAGEFGVTARYRQQQELRGGSGIVTLTRDDGGHWLATRNIVLERHPD